MKVDEKNQERLTALREASQRENEALAGATIARLEAEAREHRTAERAIAANRALKSAARDAAIRSGLDPEKPFSINYGDWTIRQDE